MSELFNPTTLPTDPTFNSVTTGTLTSPGALNISSGGSFQSLSLTAAGNLILSTPNGATQLSRPLLLMGGGLFFGAGDGDSALYRTGPAAFAFGTNVTGNASGSLSLGSLTASGTVTSPGAQLRVEPAIGFTGRGYLMATANGQFSLFQADYSTLGSLSLGSLTIGPGGNVLHMLSTKPTVNGAGSPNDAYLDLAGNRLVLFTGSATAAEGSGTWKQVALANYVP